MTMPWPNCLKILVAFCVLVHALEGRKIGRTRRNVLDYEDEETKELPQWFQNEVAENMEADREYNQEYLSTLAGQLEIVYPVQIRKNKVLDLDTRDYKTKPKRDHFHHTTIQLPIHGKKRKIRLELNSDLLSKQIKQKRSLDDTTQIIEESVLENCFYHGYVRKNPDSRVAISTCKGISGFIKVFNSTYIIQPLLPYIGVNEPNLEANWTRHPHVMYKAPSVQQKMCANGRGMWQSFRDLHMGEYLRRLKMVKAIGEQWAPIEQTKYVELALVADLALFERLNSSLEDTLLYLGQLANTMDLFYKDLNVRITVVFLEVWNLQDQIVMGADPRDMLLKFLKYKLNTMDMLTPDVAHLVSGLTFKDDEIGMAVPDSICSERAVSVSMAIGADGLLQGAAGAAHVVGHLLGLGPTEGEACMCDSWQGCIMDSHQLFAQRAVPDQFSSCSVRDLNSAVMSGLASCLFDEPFEVAYQQHCGNGIVERGEECDCASKEECEMQDPCCDRSTCLLKPWATCRFGDCCYNCTVLPSHYLCRAPHTACDVPEFCTGLSGQCPENAVIQDGQPCMSEEGYCYEGKCNTYTDQCMDVWGKESVAADDKCYETFNPAGRFNGHCGKNLTSYEYIKCHSWNVKCGLLHCTGGDPHPKNANDKVISKTTVVSEGVKYECKIINDHIQDGSGAVGMVEDGTKCGEGSLCMGRQCLPVELLMTEACPVGENNLTCSGNGVCTSEVVCFCQRGYTDVDCSIKVNVTTSTLHTTMLPGYVRETTLVSRGHTKPTKLPPTTTDSSPPVLIKASDSVSTLWLIIVLGSVAGGALVLLGCCAICYRRKSPMKNKTLYQKKKNFGSMSSFASGHSKPRSELGDDQGSSRLISFGQMPSYRADKIKKMMKRHLSQVSGSESEHSRGTDRDSTEVKLANTLPLAQPPERGILKKYPRSLEDLKAAVRARPTELEPLRGRAADYIHRVDVSANRGSYLYNSGEEETRFNGEEEEEHPPGYSPPRPPDQEDYQDYQEIHSDCEDCDCDSCDSCDKKSFSDSEYDSDEDKKDFSKDQMTQTDPNSPDGATGVSPPEEDNSIEGAKNKIMKLKNINDLLKQIDEQFNSVLRQTVDTDVSPTNSDEVRGSETEADRQYPRNSFYRQSDIEEGYSPPHRSPLLSPSTENGSKRYSSNLSSGSPDPLPSPSGILSPIYSKSPPAQLSSPDSQSPRHGTPGKPGSRQHSTPREGPVAGCPKPQDSARKRTPRRPTPPKRLSSSSPREDSSSQGSPKRETPSPSSPPVSAIPYRGAKTASSIPSSPPLASKTTTQEKPSPKPRTSLQGSPKPSRATQPQSPKHKSPPEAAARSQNPLQKLVHPLLDGYPFRKRGSLSNDVQSISEGYHSDRADNEEAIIIREIPGSKPQDLHLPFVPHPSGAYTRAPGSPGSPEDINV